MFDVSHFVRLKVFYAGLPRKTKSFTRTYFSMPSNSTSKINTLLGGIAGVGLWSP
jgi:hypothetical protein